MKKYLLWFSAVIIVLIFIFLPLPASDLILRIYFDEIEGDSCALYYTTDTQGAFCEEQCAHAQIDYEKKMVAFRLDGSLAGHLTGLRLDFPQTEQLLCIKSVTASSAGVIQKEYNPCSFFAESNIAFSNDISVTLVNLRNRAYLSTGSNDPYICLSATPTEQLQGCFSYLRLSRFFLCLFVAGSILFARKKLFNSYNSFLSPLTAGTGNGKIVTSE